MSILSTPPIRKAWSKSSAPGDGPRPPYVESDREADQGQTCYYLREVARVGDRPKIVSQRYLGKAEDIAAAMDGAASLPERTRHLAFGDVAAVWSLLQRLGAAGIIDEVVGPRRADASASVGTYLALATLNRVVAPCSKLAFADWSAPPRPATGGSGCRPRRWITAGSGTR